MAVSNPCEIINSFWHYLGRKEVVFKMNVSIFMKKEIYPVDI